MPIVEAVLVVGALVDSRNGPGELQLADYDARCRRKAERAAKAAERAKAAKASAADWQGQPELPRTRTPAPPVLSRSRQNG